MEYDKPAIGVYKRVDKPDEKPKLVGHVPIEFQLYWIIFLMLKIQTKW